MNVNRVKFSTVGVMLRKLTGHRFGKALCAKLTCSDCLLEAPGCQKPVSL